MKHLLIIFIITFSFVYSNAQESKKKKYIIIKIDSTKNNYIIDIRNNSNQLFRIISEKNVDVIKNCKQIKLDKKYKFKLLFVERIFSGGKEVSVEVDDKIVWKDDDNFRISYTNNLLGLCYKCDSK